MFNQRAGIPVKSSTGFLGRAGGFLSGAFGNSRGVWVRVSILFVVLCVIKVVMLVGMRKYLFEEHWRVNGQPHTWFNTFAFYLFGILLCVNIWVFGVRCQQAGQRAVHFANGIILLLGAMFIFLTFQVLEKNYLYSVMRGILEWRNLGSYLSLDFFFRWPFLAGWVLIYSFIYYGLIRTGRGNLVLQVTAVFAAVYVVSSMDGLKQYRDSLITVDCLGIACLVGGRNGGRALKLGSLCLPWVCVGIVYWLFWKYDADLASPVPDFMILVGGSLVLFVGISALARRVGFWSGWSWLLPFVFFGFLFLVNNNYPLAPNYSKLLNLGLWFPQYFFGEFCLAFGLLVVACCYRSFYPRGALWWLDVVNLFLLALALIDLKLTRIMGVRLDYDVLAFGDSPKMIWRMAKPYLPAVCALAVGMAAFYAIALWLIGRWHSRVGEHHHQLRMTPSGIFLLISFLTLGITGSRLAGHDKAQGQTVFLLAKTSPIWKQAVSQPMDFETLTATMKGLGMGVHGKSETVPSARAPRDLNVVLIFQESTYNKYLSLFGSDKNTQPLLSKYRDRMEIFPNFFCNYASSIHARFAAFTGLYPVQDFHAFTLKRVPVKSIFETLHDRDYSCSMFYSSSFDYTSFRDFLKDRGLSEMYDADTMPGQRSTQPVSWGVHEEETLGAIQERIRKYAKDQQRFFLTYIPAAPHYPYDATPPQFRKFKMTEYQNYEPQYLNSMLYMDWIISSVLDELKAEGLLDKTLVVITSDHGEMLGVNGGPIGHGWAVTPELANIPLIIMDPDHTGFRVNDTVGSEVDLLPTILDILGLPIPEGQIYQGSSLFEPNIYSDRLIYLNSHRQYAVIRGRQIISGDRESEGAGTNAFRRIFEIRNEGAKTLFPTVDTGTQGVPGISAFDIFQENFLRNYELYCRMIRQPK